MSKNEIKHIDKDVRISGALHPFRTQRIEARTAAGQTMKEALGEVRQEANIFLDGEPVDRDRMDEIVLQEGQNIEIRVVPQGGDDGRKVLRTVLKIAVVALSIAVQAIPGVGQIAGAALSATVLVGGNLLVDTFVPPPGLGMDPRGEAIDFNRLASLTGSRNRLAPFAPVPRVYGKHRIYPPMSSKPFTEVQSNVQFLRLLFNCGFGPLKLSNPKIGDTVIGTFDSNNNFTSNGNFEGVRIDVAEEPRLFSRDIGENSVTAAMNDDSDQVIRTTEADTDEISVDFVFPRGLYKINSDGDVVQAVVEFLIEYRETGTSDPWINAIDENDSNLPGGFDPEDEVFRDFGDDYTYDPGGTNEQRFRVTGDEPETLRNGVKWRVPNPGQYDVRITRKTSTGEGQDETVFTDATWAVLRSIHYEKPTNLPGTVQIAMRIRATDQLQGVLDNFSVEVESRLATYNGSSWDVPTFNPSTGEGSGGALTSNPAWIFADILAGTAMANPVDRATRLNGDDLLTWANFCDSEGYEYNAAIDGRTTVFDMIRDVGSIGRAAWALHDGEYTVVIDQEKSTPAQLFTPRNSSGFQGVKKFRAYPHGLKVRFLNRNEQYQEDERIVYRDGYTAANATEFESLQLTGVTDPDHAWKLGRYYLAVMEHRPEVFSFQTDVENIVCQRGDRIEFAHDVPKLGLSQGRVKSVTLDGSNNVTDLELDESVTMEAGKNYVLRIRLDDGTQVVEAIDTAAGEFNSVTLTTPSSANIQAGDLFAFGESQTETLDLIVQRIEPGSDFGATITAVNHAPEIFDADVLPVDFTASDVETTLDEIQVASELYDDDEVQFSTTGTLPAPLSAGTTYYIVNRTDTKFQVASSQGGSAIDLTDGGTGTHTVTRQIPDYTAQITEPVELENLAPPAPSIDRIRSDETTQVKDGDGSYKLAMIVSYTASSGFPSVTVEARYRRQTTGDGWIGYETAEGSNGNISLDGVQAGKSYVVQIRARNGNNVSDWVESSPHLVEGKLGEPADVTGFAAELDQVMIRLSWDENPESDLQKYEIRKGTDWASGTLMGFIDGTEATLKVTTTGSQDYFIKAIDTAGNKSINATQATVNVPSDYLDDVARVGGSPIFNNVEINSADPYIDMIETDLADKNWRIRPVSGDLHIEERDDGFNIVATPAKILAGSPDDAVVIDATSVTINHRLDATGEVDFILGAGEHFIIEKSGAIEFDLDGNSGAIGIGNNANPDVGLLVDPLARAVTASADYDRMKVTNSGQVTVPASTTSTHVVTLQLDEPNINLASGASVTEGIVLYIPEVPTEGDSNYAIKVDQGMTRLADLEVAGTINYINEDNLQVEDHTITVNKNGTDGSAEGAGLIIERPSGNHSITWGSSSGFTISDYTNISGGMDVDGHLTVEDAEIRNWTSTDSDIDGLLDGSSFGTLIQGYENGHVTIGIRNNDGNDSFSVLGISTNIPTDPYDRVLFHVDQTSFSFLNAGDFQDGLRADGQVVIQNEHELFFQDPTASSYGGKIYFDDSDNLLRFDAFSNGTLIQAMGIGRDNGIVEIYEQAKIQGLATFWDDIDPQTNYTSNIGDVNKKFLTAHIAELRVSTLVAADERVTTGGRFLVGQATELTSDLTTGATTIEVKHNNLGSGDVIQLEAGGKLEFMSVDSAASGTGPYTYTVTRNLDGTGANAWDAGVAVFNTGQSGEGFLDLYSVNSITQDVSTSGPTIAHMVRTGSAYNAIEPRAISGNLKGWYGIGSDDYGFAAGDPNAEHIIVNASGGIRMFNGASLGMQFNADVLTIGSLNYTASTDTLIAGGWEINDRGIFRDDPSGEFDLWMMQDASYFSASFAVAPAVFAYSPAQDVMINMGNIYGSSGRMGLALFSDLSQGVKDFEFSVDASTGAKTRQIAGWEFDKNKINDANEKIRIRSDNPTIQITNQGATGDELQYLFLGKIGNEGTSGFDNQWGIHAQDASYNTLFELSDRKNIIAGWTIDRRRLQKNSGDQYISILADATAISSNFTSGAPAIVLADNAEQMMVNIGNIYRNESYYGLAVFDDFGSNIKFVEFSVNPTNGDRIARINSNVDIYGNLDVGIIPSHPSTEDLVSYYSFDETAGSRVVDSGRIKNDGDFNGTPTREIGRAGNSLDFGGNSHVEAPDHADLGGLSEISISLWTYYTGDTSRDDDLIWKGSHTSGAPFGIWADTNDNFGIVMGNQTWITSQVPPKNRWAHIVVTFKGNGTIYLYIDGVLVEQNSASVASLTSNTSTLRIGQGSGTREFRGNIDEVRIYDKQITENEVRGLYLNPKGEGVTRISGSQIKTGEIISTNWTGNSGVRGTKFDLDNGILRMRYSSEDIFKFDSSGETASIAGFTFDSDSLYTGTKTTSGYSPDGLTITQGGTIHAQNFNVDIAGNINAQGGDLTIDRVKVVSGSQSVTITGSHNNSGASATGEMIEIELDGNARLIEVFQAADVTAPDTPTITKGTFDCDSRDFSWNGEDDPGTPSTGVDHYDVYRQIDGGGFSKIGTATHTGVGNSHTFTDLLNDCLNGSTFDYKIKAIDGAGNASSFSNTVSGTVLGTKVKNFEAIEEIPGKPTLYWDDAEVGNPDIDYELQVSVNSGPMNVVDNDIAATTNSYTDTSGYSSGDSLRYRIRLVNSGPTYEEWRSTFIFLP